MKAVTLRDVASAAGVHLGTASVVLNCSGGSTRVSSSTRNLVLVAAQRLGYVRNESASRLRTGNSNAIGFIGGDLRNPFFAELTAAIEGEVSLRHMQLVVSHVAGDDRAAFQRALHALRGQSLQGIVYWDESPDKIVAKRTASSPLLPIGFASRSQPGIWLDLEHAIRLAVKYFKSAGFKRLGFFAPALQGESPSVKIRWKIFDTECRALGFPTPQCATYEGESWDLEAAVAGARKLLGSPAPTEAYLSFNDIAALGLLIARRDTRAKPQVICFDGTQLVRQWPERPPYLDLKIRELARLSVALQIGDVSVPTKLRDSWLKPELIAR